MAGHRFTDQNTRLVTYSAEFMASAMHTEVIGNAGAQINMPKNKTDNVTVPFWVPYGATVSSPNTFNVTVQQHILTEGMTPAADSLTRRDVVLKLVQLGCLYSFTDKDRDLYEDDVSSGMKAQVGDRMGLVRELYNYGQLKASTNKFYAGTGATTRATVSGKINATSLRKIIRKFGSEHGKQITKVLSPSTNVGTRSVEAAYVAYCHTDAEQDIRDLPGFLNVADYGVRKTISDYEIGTFEKIRFVLSPEFAAIPDAATSVTASTYTLKTTSGTNPDVYQTVVMAENGFAQVTLRGLNSVSPIYIDPSVTDKSDPLNQKGYIGAKFWLGSGVVNNGWVAVLEHGVSDLA